MHYYFCPLCKKNGVRSRIRPYQINLEEGIWICEAHKCPWPFGYAEPNYFQRDAHSCDWTKDPPNPPEEYLSPLTELSLYTPPTTPAESEASKKSTDTTTVGSEDSPQLSVKDTSIETHYENKSSDAKRDSNDLQWLDLLDLDKILTDEDWEATKVKDVNASSWLETEFTNFSDTASANPSNKSSESSSNKNCDNIMAGNCEYLSTSVTCISKAFESSDNPCKNSDLSERKSDPSSKKRKQYESKTMQLNNATNNSSDNIKILSPTTNSDLH